GSQRYYAPADVGAGRVCVGSRKHVRQISQAHNAGRGRMARALILSLLALAAGCASSDDGALRAHIAEDIVLTLPTPPAYPDTRTVVQTGQARYGERQAAFDAVLSLAPDRVEIVLTMPAGPRLATIVWDEGGVRQDRSVLAPEGVPVENILADLFV